MVNGLPQYPFAQPDAQTFPLSVILNETRTRSALVDEYRVIPSAAEGFGREGLKMTSAGPST
jgi:hypothetical protein